MIPNDTPNTYDWSQFWNPTKVNDQYYYLEHKGLQSIVSTRIYCQKGLNKSVEWPFVAIRLTQETYTCHIKFVEYAFDIIPELIRRSVAADPHYLGNLIEKKVDVINYNLLKMRNFCHHRRINVNDEVLVGTIRIIEKKRGEWIRAMLTNTQSPLHPKESPLFLTVLSTGQVIIEFPKGVEKANAKLIHEAYEYDESQALVSLRPTDPKAWKKEIRVYKILKTEGLLREPDSGFVTTLHIDETQAIQIRCIGDLLTRIYMMSDDQKLNAALKIAKAIDCLHRLNIYHGDLKLENVLVNREHVYVIDFGYCHFKRWKKVSGYFGTHGLTAPELYRDAYVYERTKVKGKPRDLTKFDSFSFGVLLWSLLYKERTPFEFKEGTFDLEKYEEQIKANEKVPKPPSKTLGHVIRGLMKFDPKKRWEVKKACKILGEIQSSRVSKRGFDGCDFLSPYKSNKESSK